MAILLSLFQLVFLLSNVWTSYKTLKPPPNARRREVPSTRAAAARKRELKACLAVWIVWATWSCAEKIADKTVGLVMPFYTDIKTVFLVALFFTRAMIAEPLLLHLIRPTLKPYISTIDATLDLLHAIGHVITHFALAPWRYLTSPTPERPHEVPREAAASIQSAESVYVSPIEEIIVQTHTPTSVNEAEMPPPRHSTAPSKQPRAQARETVKPSAPVGTRTRRGVQAIISEPQPGTLRNTVRLRLDDSPIEIQQPASMAPPQPFIVRSAIAPLLSVPDMPPPASITSISPPAPSPAPAPLPSYLMNPTITRSPRLPGGYAMSTTDQSETDQSVTVVQSQAEHSPTSFLFPEPPPIEVFAPGSSKPSELPRARLRTISARRSPQVPPITHLPTPAPTPAPLTEAVRPILSRQTTGQSFERFPSASSATVAAEARRPARTYAMFEPTLSRTAMPLKRKPSITQPEAEPKHPVSSATLARRQRKASTASLEQQQHHSGSAPLSALEPSLAKSRARLPDVGYAQPVPPAAEISSASSSTSTSTSSRRAGGVSAGKKRSVKGHVVESPRLPPSTSEVESAAEGDDKASSTGSAKKKRKVEEVPTVLDLPPPASISTPDPTPAPIPVSVPIFAPVREPAKLVHPAVAALKVMDDQSVTEDDDNSDDESWSAFDELKTPNRKARSLRSRTVFSDDGTSFETPPPVPPLPLPRPTLSVQIPPDPTTKRTQARPPQPVPAPDPISVLSSISDFPKSDAFATIAAVRGGPGKDIVSQSQTQSQSNQVDSSRYGSRAGAGADAPPIRVSRGNAAAAARGLRLRSAASRIS